MQAERSCASIEAPATRSQVSRGRDKENDSMSVKLTTHGNGDVIVVDTSGKLTLGEGTSILRTKIRELWRVGPRGSS
jgi:hypothetical protein